MAVPLEVGLHRGAAGDLGDRHRAARREPVAGLAQAERRFLLAAAIHSSPGPGCRSPRSRRGAPGVEAGRRRRRQPEEALPGRSPLSDSTSSGSPSAADAASRARRAVGAGARRGEPVDAALVGQHQHPQRALAADAQLYGSTTSGPSPSSATNQRSRRRGGVGYRRQPIGHLRVRRAGPSASRRHRWLTQPIGESSEDLPCARRDASGPRDQGHVDRRPPARGQISPKRNTVTPGPSSC